MTRPRPAKVKGWRLGELLPIADDVTPFCGTHHTADDIVGYAAVRTEKGGGKVRDIAYFDAFSYREALHLVKTLRIIDRDTYGRLDVLYNDGCRGAL